MVAQLPLEQVIQLSPFGNEILNLDNRACFLQLKYFVASFCTFERLPVAGIRLNQNLMIQQTANLSLFHNELKSFVLKRVKDKALAEDIVQDVFLKVHSKLSQLKDSEKMVAWIYQIARNTINDHFRRDQRLARVIPEVEVDSESSSLNDCVAHCLKAMVTTLPDKYREAFELAELKNVSQIELAQQLNISYSGAKSRVQRARQMLRQKMEELLIIETDCYGNVIACEDCNTCSCE
jgi:RNA polymerase sigma-70 factor, ECF subfamily